HRRLVEARGDGAAPSRRRCRQGEAAARVGAVGHVRGARRAARGRGGVSVAGYVPLNAHRHRAHAKLIDAVGRDKRVLEVGCSSGYLSRPLTERGNTVVGIELDAAAAREAEAYCERVLVGDVESMELPFE